MREFLSKTEIQAVLLTAALGVAGFVASFLYVKSRDRLSNDAKDLIRQMKADGRSKVVGLTVFSISGIGEFYEPAFAEPGLENLIKPGNNRLSDQRNAIEELISKGKLVLDSERGAMQVFRFVE